MPSHVMDIAALGRPFNLGMLYDARTDALIPGLTLWNEKTLQEHTAQSSQPSSKFEISASDTIESKSSLLDVEASLKASFLCGLIEVGGSAKYLNDKKKFKNQSRVTCQYKATTHFKELSMIDLGKVEPHQMDVIQKGLATHVVTGILYGANAFFVFDNEKSEDSSVQDIQGSMQAVIKKIPSLNIEGKVKLNLSDKEENLTKNFSCKFYGDFILKSNPSTFEDAVKTYIQLPQLLGENGENAVPLKVWLMPLKNLDPKADELMSVISVGLVRKAQDTLEDLREMEMRCNDSLEDRVVENFPQIRKDLSSFQKLCGYYESNLKQTMAKKIPSIRDGKEDESSLKHLFEDRDKSPFSHDKLSKWLDHKEKEINIIRFCVDTMEGTKIVSKSQLDRKVRTPGVEDALCFVFTSLDSDDCCLDAMTNYLDSSSKSGSTNEDPWYFSDEVFTKMRKKAKGFHALAKAKKNNSRFCFLIAAIENEKYKGATIYHYKDGILVTEDFSKAELPPVESITDRRDLIWYACDLNLNPNTAYKNLILSEGNKKATFGAQQKYPDHSERFTECSQVFCKERLSGRHYWEVEWNVKLSGYGWEGVYVGVSYSGMKRDGDRFQSSFHNTANSWCFGETFVPENKHLLMAWHNGWVWEGPLPSGGCSRVGVFLDWPAGTLSFYKISDNTLSHLYTFKTKFNEPVCPGLSISKPPNSAYLRPFE